MKRQNRILMQLKLNLFALHRNLSTSRLRMNAIGKMAGEKNSYEEAHNRQIVLMRKGIDLGFQKSVDRNDLHER